MKYKVLVREISEKIIVIDSNDYDWVKCYEHAEDLVYQAYRCGDIILDAEDSVYTEFEEVK